MDFTIQGISLLALTFGLVQFLKDVLKLSGNMVRVLSVTVAAGLFGVFQALPMLAPEISQWAELAVLALAAGLGAGGYYQAIKSKTGE